MDATKQEYPPLTEEPESSVAHADELIKRVETLDAELNEQFTREISILFTDIKGSTTFFKTHGDIAGRLLMQRHYDMLSPIIVDHEGTVVKTLGDSIMASFNDPADAVNAAMEMQRKLFKYNASLSKEEPLRIRIGINHGKGIIEDNDIYGDVVNVASKLVSVGDSEQIVVSESIHEKLHHLHDLTFTPLTTEQPLKDNLTLKMYVVKWQEEEEPQEQEMTALSLADVNRRPLSGGEDETTPRHFSAVEELLRQKSIRTTIDPEWRLTAFFEDAPTAVKTAAEILRLCEKSGQAVHIGIHTGTVLVTEVEIQGGEEADEVREKSGKNEIYISQPTYESIMDDETIITLPLPGTLKNGTPLHKILLEPPEKRRVEEPHPVTQHTAHVECFYCGSINHRPFSCPSKSIPSHTHSCNEIGYLSPTEIKALFATHFPQIVKPHRISQDEIAVPLISDRKSDSLKVPFEAFYEVNEVFQLRFLRKVWSSDAADWSNLARSTPIRRSGGFLWLGEDSLRVSKHSEALTMFSKAAEHNPDDYKPCSGLGFLALESGNHEKAFSQFRKALNRTSNRLQQSYLLLLISRIHEIRGHLKEAIGSVRESLITTPHFLDAKYRLAVLLAKSGDKRESIAILKTLIAAEATFYPRILIDPELHSMKKEIDLLIKELFEYAKAQASHNIETIRNNLIQHGEWFSKDDDEYKSAEKIFTQTLKLSEGNSYFGFLDIISYGFDIKDKLRSVLRNKRRSVRRNIDSFYGLWEEHDRYFENYCYKNLIGHEDTFLLKQFYDMIIKAKDASAIESAESLRTAQNMLSDLTSLAQRIESNHKKLHFLKMCYFTVDCSSKVGLRLVLWTLLVSSLFSLVLIGYQAYSQSVYDFSAKAIADYLKFSSFCGALCGAGASIYWIYKNFDQLYAKLK